MIDTLSIGISAVIILMGVIACVSNPLLWVPIKKKDVEEEPMEVLPPLSVIIQVNDNIQTLERNLPLLLQQEYEPGVQYIIVANEGDSAADDLMKRYKGDTRLKSTFIPKTARYISREKLGVTLGVKAASNEWCILMDALCYPKSNQWLQHIGAACKDDKNLVIGYSNYAEDSKAYQRFYRVKHFCHIWFDGIHGKAYAANGSNIAFRKSEFIKGDGFRGNLGVVRGEYDYIINKYARKDGTAYVTSREGTLTETAPYKKQWNRFRIFYIHSRKTLSRRFSHDILPVLSSLMLHLTTLSALATGCIGYMMQSWMILAACCLSLIILFTCRTITAKRVCRHLETMIPAWAIVPLELTSVWHNIGAYLRYRHASKYDFTCHKL